MSFLPITRRLHFLLPKRPGRSCLSFGQAYQSVVLKVLLWGACAVAPCFAWGGEAIRYVLDLRQPSSHLVRVTMTVPVAPPGTELGFPAWNALYQIRDFVRNVQELEARCDGEPFPLERVSLHTWRSGGRACGQLQLQYAVYAHEESPFSSVLNREHGFFNFALLLFYLPAERERPIRVQFLLPDNWKLATLLPEGQTPGEFTAPNYDMLVDSPAEAGRFQEYQYVQDGAIYRVVVHADVADYSADRLLSSLQKITAAATGLMRDVPFTRYTFILHFPRDSNCGGAMEHRDGTAICSPAANLASRWQGLEATLAHEFFHAWNVKRIRPQNLEPVDYLRGNDTRDLWFSEGLASTYQWLILLRAGLINPQAFYRQVAEEIQRLQSRPARHHQSVEQAGMEAWLEKYSGYLRPERSISYYNKGALLGFLIDLAIRHHSQNRRSLDDVMRRLNEDFARRHRFFTPADLRVIVAELAPAFSGLDHFFQDYVSGTRELDYDTYLGYAGLRLAISMQQGPAVGFTVTRAFDGRALAESVEPESSAAKAGLEQGDALLKLNGRSLGPYPQAQIDDLKPGQQARLRVRRERREFEIKFRVGAAQEADYRLEEIPEATPDQRRVRHGWLEGLTAADAEPEVR